MNDTALRGSVWVCNDSKELFRLLGRCVCGPAEELIDMHWLWLLFHGVRPFLGPLLTHLQGQCICLQAHTHTHTHTPTHHCGFTCCECCAFSTKMLAVKTITKSDSLLWLCLYVDCMFVRVRVCALVCCLYMCALYVCLYVPVFLSRRAMERWVWWTAWGSSRKKTCWTGMRSL